MPSKSGGKMGWKMFTQDSKIALTHLPKQGRGLRNGMEQRRANSQEVGNEDK